MESISTKSVLNLPGFIVEKEKAGLFDRPQIKKTPHARMPTLSPKMNPVESILLNFVLIL